MGARSSAWRKSVPVFCQTRTCWVVRKASANRIRSAKPARIGREADEDENEEEDEDREEEEEKEEEEEEDAGPLATIRFRISFCTL